VGVPFPVKAMEPKSLAETICEWWAFLPRYLIPAAKQKDPVERMKAVISFTVAGLHLSAK